MQHSKDGLGWQQCQTSPGIEQLILLGFREGRDSDINSQVHKNMVRAISERSEDEVH